MHLPFFAAMPKGIRIFDFFYFFVMNDTFFMIVFNFVIQLTVKNNQPITFQHFDAWCHTFLKILLNIKFLWPKNKTKQSFFFNILNNYVIWIIVGKRTDQSPLIKDFNDITHFQNGFIEIYTSKNLQTIWVEILWCQGVKII